MAYPKWKYHATKPAVIVADQAAEKALGEGWGESPAEFEKKAAAPSPSAPASKKNLKAKDGGSEK